MNQTRMRINLSQFTQKGKNKSKNLKLKFITIKNQCVCINSKVRIVQWKKISSSINNSVWVNKSLLYAALPLQKSTQNVEKEIFWLAMREELREPVGKQKISEQWSKKSCWLCW